MPQHFGLPAHLDLHHLPRKPPLVRGGARKEYLERRIQPCTRARRPRDQERPLALGKELGIEQEERKCAEMVPVQMREHDPIDAIGIEAVRLERDQRGGTAIDQERALRRLDEKTRVEPAAGAEGISRSYDRQAHAQADALGRAETVGVPAFEIGEVEIARFVQCATLGQQFQNWIPDLGLGPSAPRNFNIECCQVAAGEMARQI